MKNLYIILTILISSSLSIFSSQTSTLRKATPALTTIGRSYTIGTTLTTPASLHGTNNLSHSQYGYARPYLGPRAFSSSKNSDMNDQITAAPDQNKNIAAIVASKLQKQKETDEKNKHDEAKRKFHENGAALAEHTRSDLWHSFLRSISSFIALLGM